jgi:hypothetical protein
MQVKLSVLATQVTSTTKILSRESHTSLYGGQTKHALLLCVISTTTLIYCDFIYQIQFIHDEIIFQHPNKWHAIQSGNVDSSLPGEITAALFRCCAHRSLPERVDSKLNAARESHLGELVEPLDVCYVKTASPLSLCFSGILNKSCLGHLRTEVEQPKKVVWASDWSCLDYPSQAEQPM